MSDLRPCPFCGNDKPEKHGCDRMLLWWVACGSPTCETQGPSALTAPAAVAAWNHRPTAVREAVHNRLGIRQSTRPLTMQA